MPRYKDYVNIQYTVLKNEADLVDEAVGKEIGSYFKDGELTFSHFEVSTHYRFPFKGREHEFINVVVEAPGMTLEIANKGRKIARSHGALV